ncbi:MAG: phenylalanine--tRNA ligase subunit beta, partial [Verrucomicrobiota bacterium]
LHAFDLGLVAAGDGGVPGIVVRRAAEGETFVTLDGQERTLTAESLMIADPARGIALAGIMGGRNTEIHGGTGEVLVESAHFAAPNIRRTSKRLGLRTDASYRFERGSDPNWGLEYASARCVALLVELAGGIPADGVVDAYPAPVAPRRVTLRHHRVNALLGVELSPERIETYLGRLGLGRVQSGTGDGGGAVVFSIPTFRVDLKRETDLIEEVVRLHGVDQVPSTPPRGALGHHAFDAVHDRLMELRRCLASLGLTETQGQTLVSDGLAARVVPGVVRLANPLSSDMNVLRPSLLPGLLDILAHNLSRRNEDLALFEVGRVFTAGRERPVEGWRVALALTGARQPVFWSGAERGARVDLFDLKGILEEFLERTGLRGVSWIRQPDSAGIFVESAVLSLGGRLELGRCGQLQPGLARPLGLRDPVFLAELDVDQWLARRNPARSFKPLPTFPAVRRDLALVVPESTPHDAVLAAVRQARLENLEKVEIFDVFRGGQVPAGHKSVAYGLTYRAADRTLKDEEVQASQARLVQTLRTALGATVRE